MTDRAKFKVKINPDDGTAAFTISKNIEDVLTNMLRKVFLIQLLQADIERGDGIITYTLRLDHDDLLAVSASVEKMRKSIYSIQPKNTEHN